MIDQNEIQEAIVAKLKADASLTAALATSAEIREDQFQGVDYFYPCVRVKIGQQVPKIPNCPLYSQPFIIQAFSEKDSSKESNSISYLVSEAIKKGFTYKNVKFIMISRTLVEAVRKDERTWLAEVHYASLVQHA